MFCLKAYRVCFTQLLPRGPQCSASLLFCFHPASSHSRNNMLSQHIFHQMCVYVNMHLRGILQQFKTYETVCIHVSGTSHADVRDFLPHTAQHGGRISVR
ncbi:hypothetical protein ATANTOWER_020068 [Ataeniobius toweri]|uniref:Secreted protein n=1 Tax=Ataeniobius toweri TaxID=208326 RepID=A0ABU7AIB7_9TELE|nr:hypothetical protein [Ataeniobius toweri]